ncbi:MAG: hypothetical protein A2537_02250 [Candidatus Magasanikbacteria bacterium RIFOXYD2_FULL_36_9]|uniref:HTH arsR-type domain-containing protein n=1 Tax=Candidatus Magasanikbacteria bacterium RIFOXYD2_FULL_36_9 TaxID=1798707 RepID=A0A1F6P159_9BACT|nr:MAG: hypothetical protein A2537_02250 [Candidatus Magasanikbacteria bacterium RIFOXYD2_FULL_36_9]
MKKTKLDNQIELLAKKLLLSADYNRLRILCTIFCFKKCCVSDIAERLGISVAIASHHLKVMSKNDLLFSERSGKKICYSLADNSFAKDIKKLICKYKNHC